MAAKLTTKEFIAKATAIHGDKYSYSKVDYVNSATLVDITCHKHKDFVQSPTSHLMGRGCPKCGNNKNRKRRTKTEGRFIAEARAIHGDKYDYSKIKYVKNSVKITITCILHGDFIVAPDKHLAGRGCRKCRYIDNGSVFINSTDDFINAAKDVHGDKYIYSESVYINHAEKNKDNMQGAWRVHANKLKAYSE